MKRDMLIIAPITLAEEQFYNFANSINKLSGFLPIEMLARETPNISAKITEVCIHQGVSFPKISDNRISVQVNSNTIARYTCLVAYLLEKAKWEKDNNSFDDAECKFHYFQAEESMNSDRPMNFESLCYWVYVNHRIWHRANGILAAFNMTEALKEFEEVRRDRIKTTVSLIAKTNGLSCGLKRPPIPGEILAFVDKEDLKIEKWAYQRELIELNKVLGDENAQELEDLKSRLSEYEIISEDIADLKKLREENEKLKRTVARLQKTKKK